MKKDIDQNLAARLNELRGNEPLRSPHRELINEVAGDIYQACNSLIPNSYLRLAESRLMVYERKANANRRIVDGLWGVVDSSWKLYENKMEVGTF